MAPSPSSVSPSRPSVSPCNAQENFYEPSMKFAEPSHPVQRAVVSASLMNSNWPELLHQVIPTHLLSSLFSTSKAPLFQHRLRNLLDVSQCLCSAVKEGANGRRLRKQGSAHGHNPVCIYGSTAADSSNNASPKKATGDHQSSGKRIVVRMKLGGSARHQRECPAGHVPKICE